MADSIFEADELEADALAPDAEAPAVEEQPEAGPERDEHGRFKPKEPKPGESEEAAPEAEAEEGKKGDGTVPQGALHAERERRKSVEAELAKAREQLGALAKLREQAAARKPEPLPETDDPAALEHLRARLGETEATVTRFSQEREMQAITAREMQEIGNIIVASEQAFRQQQPDYDAAVDHIVQARKRQLEHMRVPPAQITAMISEEASDLIRVAISQGRDPAEFVYNYAESYGYRPAQGEQRQEEQPQGGAAAKLAAIAKAQGASKSLGNGGGGGSHQLNAESIAALSQDEFDKLYSTPEGRALIDAL